MSHTGCYVEVCILTLITLFVCGHQVMSWTAGFYRRRSHRSTIRVFSGVEERRSTSTLFSGVEDTALHLAFFRGHRLQVQGTGFN